MTTHVRSSVYDLNWSVTGLRKVEKNPNQLLTVTKQTLWCETVALKVGQLIGYDEQIFW